MIKQHLNQSKRYLLKHLQLSLINIIGLTIGLSCCILVFMITRHELGFDKMFSDTGSIYRLGTEIRPPEQGKLIPVAGTVVPALKQLQLEYPDAVQHFSRLESNMLSVKSDNSLFSENVYFVDADFFKIFDFRFIQGNPASSVSTPDSVVLTESMARKYFGDTNVVGKTLLFEDNKLMNVTGVIEDTPPDVHFTLGIVVSASSIGNLLGEWQTEMDYSWEPRESAYGYIKLAEGASISQVRSGLDDMLQRNAGQILEFFEFKLNLQNLTDIHLNPGSDEPIPGKVGHIAFVYAGFILGILVLITACINFANLCNARLSQRTREIGVKKTMGASTQDIAAQLMTETYLILVAALAISFFVVYLVLPFVGDHIGRDLSGEFYLDIGLVIFTFLLVAVSGLIAGLYPSLILARLPVHKALKGEAVGTGGKNLTSKALLTVQFFLVTTLITVSLAGHYQLNKIKTIDLGYQPDNVLMLSPLRTDASVFRYINELGNNYETLKNEIAKHSGVEIASGSLSVNFKSGFYPVRKENTQTRGVTRLEANEVDYGYLQAFGIKLVAGRDFSKDMATDKLNNNAASVILTSKGIGKLGYESAEDAIGKRMRWRNNMLTIVGVVDQIAAGGGYRDLYLDMLINSSSLNTVIVKLKGAPDQSVLNHIEQTWREFVPNYPLNIVSVNNLYATERGVFTRILNTFSIIALLAVFISCMGLYAIARFVTDRRSKEIVVRKILGAEVHHIIGLIIRDFSKPIAIAIALSIPVAWLLIGKLLARFPEQAASNAGFYVVAIAITIGLAWITIAAQTMNIAAANPSERLHYE